MHAHGLQADDSGLPSLGLLSQRLGVQRLECKKIENENLQIFSTPNFA